MISTLPACQCTITCASSGWSYAVHQVDGHMLCIKWVVICCASSWCAYGVQRILNVEYGFPANIRVSDDCKDLMKQILVADPSRRLSIPQIMEHPWSVTHP